MPTPIQLNVPLNRVEGDLELRVEVTDGLVTDAWCSGTMYRGFERLMVGRDALDGLVITPRICGMCSTAHLTAAVRAVESIRRINPPPDAVRLRNLALAVECVQSDLRQAFLMYAGDLANERWVAQAWYGEAQRRFAPLAGEAAIAVLRESKRLIEIIALIGGQWPHSSFMVPGGLVSSPSRADLLQCEILLREFTRWYEQRVLGCTLERFSAVQSGEQLDAWLAESPVHAESDLGFWLRCVRDIGLDQLGRGHNRFVCYGGYPQVDGDRFLFPAGFAIGANRIDFDQTRIAEDTSHAWYDDSAEPRHPSIGRTVPYASGAEANRYSWAKAPRYDGHSAETGPLAELLLAGNPLFGDLVAGRGASALVRQMARLLRPATLLAAAADWLAECRGELLCYETPRRQDDGEGLGLVEAARGALGHWVRIADGRIAAYQIITPTAWHTGPRDGLGQRGYVEEALLGTPVADPGNPVELGLVTRSFDLCQVCTVHLTTRGRRLPPMTLGLPA